MRGDGGVGVRPIGYCRRYDYCTVAAATTVRDTHSALCGYCIYHYTNNTYNSRATILRGGGGPSFCPSLLAQGYNSLYSKAAQLQQQNQLQRVDLWVNNPIGQQLGPALPLQKADLSTSVIIVSYGRSRPIAHSLPQSTDTPSHTHGVKWNQKEQQNKI